MKVLKSTTPVHTARIETPCGGLLLGVSAGELVVCDWTDGWHRKTIQNRLERHLAGPWIEGTPADDPLLERTVSELSEYFAGRRRTFDLPLRFLGTPFQNAVWHALLEIPFGELRTYAEIARAAGSPAAVRAAGAAVGENPFSIIVPCHRVIGSDLSVTGYGGGFAAKRLLLELEGHRLATSSADRAEGRTRILPDAV